MTDVTPDAAVVARVKSLAAFGERPALTDAEVITAIQHHPRVDRDGIPANVAGWVQTWDINAAVAELWALKAGRVAGDFSFKADGTDVAKGDVMAHCLAMEAHYAAKAGGAAMTGAQAGVGPLHGVVING